MNIDELNIANIRSQFPVLDQQVNGKPLIYFDNAATTQKPLAVIEAISDYYRYDNANIHRGIHTLAERATEAFEASRLSVQKFINSYEKEEIIFTKGTTEGINLVAYSFGKTFIKANDEIIISGMEHHSNIVPWQILCQDRGAILKVIPITDVGELDMDAYAALLSTKTKMVACVYVSNALGTINPVKKIIELAHNVGAKVLLDGAQAVSHLDIDVQDLDCDFFVCSAHKLYGPTGVGVLYGKRALLDAMPPYQSGGEMIKEVSFEGTTFNELPYKFEAGTPNIAGVIGLNAAIQFVNRTGKTAIRDYEQALLVHCVTGLKNIKGNTLADPILFYGIAKSKVAVCSFAIPGLHHFDAGMMLDAKGIAVRTGHHCTQPLMNRFGIDGTVRASFAVYNTKKEIDVFVEAVKLLIRK
ncbi:MAG: cysteine desulfurase [Bacteroidia bacterium]|nr:cysteine desulfurase [Bacteroidia bacterium]